jgi:hypothetical protein
MKKVLDLMKRMGENVSPESFWDNVMSDTPIIITEGLITSYDSTMVLNAICDSFHLAKNGNRKEMLLYTMKDIEYVYIGDAFLVKKENDEDVIKVSLDTNESFIEKIEQRLLKYGWALYRTENENNKTVFYFEKRYPTCGTVGKLLRFTDKLYHIAPENAINKILKQGLIPKKSKTYGFENEPRVYLWLNEPENTQWDVMFKTRGNTEGIVLSIDLTKLNPQNKMYFDNRMPNALFSLEPIPNKAIEIIKNKNR